MKLIFIFIFLVIKFLSVCKGKFSNKNKFIARYLIRYINFFPVRSIGQEIFMSQVTWYRTGMNRKIFNRGQKGKRILEELGDLSLVCFNGNQSYSLILILVSVYLRQISAGILILSVYISVSMSRSDGNPFIRERVF